MIENCDGNNSIKKERSVVPEGEEKRSRSPLNNGKKNLALETSFHGFVQIPRVVLPRVNITPYLDANGRPKTVRRSKKSYLDVHKAKLSQKCIVKLTRDDLNKFLESISQSGGVLKVPRSFPNGIHSIDSSGSDSELTNTNKMVLKCKICGKSYNSNKRLQKHQKNKHIVYVADTKKQKRVSFSDHVIVHELKEYHECRKCPKIFEEYNLLRVHMKQKHRKRKCYICNYCSKKFVDRMFFKIHIKLHCDNCGELFTTKYQCNDHRRNVCKTLKMHKCQICNSAFFRRMDLKDHFYSHIDPCFVCDVCKDQFKTKCGLAHHILFLHSKKRPASLFEMLKVGNERLYLCRFCSESTVDKDLIELHVQTLPDLSNKAMTGYKNYYFCDQCMKKFDNESDMLQHKWTHFLNTDGKESVKSILGKPLSAKTFNAKQEIPQYMKPTIVLEKIDLTINNKDDSVKDLNSNKEKAVESKELEITNVLNDKTLKSNINPVKKRKTLMSKHHCQTCGKYYSTNYTLQRHIETQHSDYDSLRCNVCEETFTWPSLLRSHKCIRLNLPEMPFDDARPEIHFENPTNDSAFDDLNLNETDDFMESVDFDIPAPIVELKEGSDVNGSECIQGLGYKIMFQEVPIEF